MTGSPDSSRPMEGWMPTRLFRGVDRPTVEWCHLGERRLTEPFFDETVRAARADGCPVRTTPADVLADLGHALPDVPVAG